MKKKKVKFDEKKFRSEAQQKVEKKQEAIVINAREKLLPILKDKNLNIEQSKLVCDLLAVAIQQGQFELLAKSPISDLNLLNFITDGYPQSDSVRAILNSINEMSMVDGINMLQWMVAKINKMVEDENKKRNFSDLNLDF